jgi:hypothetical protein
VRCPAGADPRLSAWGTALELAGLGLQVREPRVPYDGQIRSDFKMQRFESCRLELRVLAISILECRCSNPAASTGRSASNAYGIGSRRELEERSRGPALHGRIATRSLRTKCIKESLGASLSAFCPTCDPAQGLICADGELWPVLHLYPRNQLIFAALGLEDRGFTLLNIEPVLA